MLPDRENLRDVLITIILVGTGALLIWLWGCGKPAEAENLLTKVKVVDGIDHPLTEPQPIYGGKVELAGQNGIRVPMPIMSGANSPSPIEGLQAMVEHSPKCPNKTRALVVLMPDSRFPDVWRGAYLCNAREIVPATSSTKWRYADQKRYGYREW